MPDDVFEKQDIIFVQAENFYDAEDVLFNMALLSAATYLVKNDFKVLCFTPHIISHNNTEDLIKFFQLYNPYLVCLYATADNIYAVREAAQYVKEANINIKTAVCGPYVCADPEKILEDKNFDFAVLGEPEETVKELLSYLAKKQGAKTELKDIKGIVYKDNGAVVKAPERELIADIDALPAPEIMFAMHNKGYYPISTYRACPYDFSGCVKFEACAEARHRALNNVFNEIQQAVEGRGFGVIQILDSPFGADIEKTKELLGKLINYQRSQNKNIVFYCEGKIDSLAANPDLLETMSACGFEKIALKVKSGSQKMLDNYGEGIKLKQITDIVTKCYELNVATVSVEFVFGGPGENKKTIEETAKFAEKLINLAPGMVEINSSFFAPHPGSKFYDETKDLKVPDPLFKAAVFGLEPHTRTKALNFRDLNNLHLQFLSRVSNYMFGKAPGIHPGKIAKNFYMAKHFGHTNQWFANFYAGYPALRIFFGFSLDARFVILRSVKDDSWKNLHPIRIIPQIVYEPWDDSTVINGSFEERRLTDKFEKEAYHLAVGKLKIIDIIGELKGKFELKETDEDIWKNKLRPFYEALEKQYYLACYR